MSGKIVSVVSQMMADKRGINEIAAVVEEMSAQREADGGLSEYKNLDGTWKTVDQLTGVDEKKAQDPQATDASVESQPVDTELASETTSSDLQEDKIDISQIEGKNPAHTKKLQEYHTKMQADPNFKYNPNTGGYDKVNVKTEEELAADLQAKKDQQAKEDEEYLNKPHANFSDIAEGRGMFDDKEQTYINNLSKFYDGENLQFEIIDEWGTDDKIKVTDAFGRTHVLDPNTPRGEMIMSRFGNWVNESRKLTLENKGREKSTFKPDIQVKDTQGNEMLPQAEDKDSKIQALEEVIANEPGPSQKKADAEAELETYVGERRDNEFDKTQIREKNLADKYNAGLEEITNLNTQSLIDRGVEEGSPEWIAHMEKVTNQYNTGFGKGSLAIVEEYQGGRDKTSRFIQAKLDLGLKTKFEGDLVEGEDFFTKKEIYETAINNLKKDIMRGVGKDFGDKEVDFSDWLSEDEEWKLLDGLTFEEIESLAGKSSIGTTGIEAGLWDSRRKQAHIDKVKNKHMSQKNRDTNKDYDAIKGDYDALTRTGELLETEGKSLNNRTNMLNARVAPIAKKIEQIEIDRVNKEKELDSLKQNIENTPQPTTQQELDDYNENVAQYKSKANSYNNFIENSKNVYEKYEELRLEGDKLNSESESYNERLEQNKADGLSMDAELKGISAEKQKYMAEYGYTVADGLFKKNGSDYTNIDEYDKWRKQNKISKGFLDPDAWAVLGQGILNTAGKYYTGTSLWALNGLDALTGNAISNDKAYTGLDALNDAYERYTNYDYFGKAQIDDYEKGEMSWSDKGARAVAEGLPFMMAIMASGGKDAFKAGTWTKFLPKGANTVGFAQKIRMGKTAFHITSMDNVIEGKKMGLSNGQSVAYGGLMSMATAVVQGIMPDINLVKGGGGFVSNIAKNGLAGTLAKTTTKEGLRYAGTRWMTNVFSEVLEEEVEMFLGDAVKLGFGLGHAVESTDINNHLRLIHDTAWLTGTTGTIGARKDYNDVRNRIHKELKGDMTGHLETMDHMEIELSKKLEKAKKDGDTEAIEAYEFELDNVQKSKEYLVNFKNAVKVAPKNVTNEQLADLTEKIRLEKLKLNQDPSFHAEINLQLEKLNEKIENSVIQQTAVENNKKIYEQTVNTVKMLARQNGSEVQEFKNDPEGTKGGRTAQEKIDDWLKENNYDEKSRSEAKKGMYGTYLTDKNGKKVLVINAESSQSGEGVNVAAHEFLHQMLESTFAAKDADGNILRDIDGNIQIDKKQALGIGFSLAEWVAETQDADYLADSELMKRLNSYGSKPTNVQAQEMLTLLSDAIVSGDMVFEENIFTKLGDVMRRGLQAAGMDVTFKTGKDVFNFVKDYNRSIAKGKGLTRAQKKVMSKGAAVGGTVAQVISSDVVTEMAKIDSIEERRNWLAQNEIDPDSNSGQALLQSKRSDVASLLARYDGSPRGMISETLSKTKDGRDVYELRDSRNNYVDDPFFRSEFGQEIAPIVETITKRLFDPIPPNLRNDITRGQYMNDLTAIAASLVDREFNSNELGEGQTIDDFISNRLNLRANSLAAELGIESTVEEGGLGAVVGLDQAADIAAEEDTGPVTDNTSGIVLLNRLATPEQKAEIEKIIKSKIKGNQIEVAPGKFKNISELDYKSLKNLLAPQIAEMFGIKAIENYTSSTKTLKNDDVIRARMFIGKNADVIYQTLPFGVTASGTATGIKQVVLSNFYTKSDKRVKFDKKEGGAGIFPQVKNKMSPEQFAAAFGVEKGKLMDVKGQNPATLISGLMDEVGKAMTNQMVRQALDSMNKAGDTEIAGRIKLLGDGKSDMLFSQAAIAKTGAERSISFYEKMRSLKGDNLTIADGNVTNALKVHFDEEIKSGAFDVTNAKGKVTQTTEQLIEKVGAQIQVIHDRMTRGKTVPPTQVFNGQLISDIVLDQFLSDNIDDTKSYKSVAGEGIQSINNPEVGKSARKAMQKLADKFSSAFVDKYLVPSIAHAHKYGNGEYKFKPGTLEYEINKSREVSRNRFGLANDPNDAQKLMGIEGGESGRSRTYGEKVQPHTRPKTGDGIPSQGNIENIIKEQQDANKAFREVVAELKRLYNNKEISKNDVVAILQSMNGNPKGLTRIAAILDFIPAGKYTNYKGEFRLEHMTPALQINLSALNNILSNDTQADIDFQNDMDGYKIAYLPIKFDNLVNTLYSSTKPIYGQESVFRYYNLELPGFDLEMKQLSTGEVIGPSFINNTEQQQLFKDNDSKAVNGDKLYFSKKADVEASDKYNSLLIPSKQSIDQAQAVDNNTLDRRETQNKILLSKNPGATFNGILEATTGVEAFKTFSEATARKRGQEKGKYNILIPPSAEDFKGLLYQFLGKGAKGDKDLQFFNDTLLRPFARADREINIAKQTVSEDYRALKKAFPDVKKKLGKIMPGTDFTWDAGTRVYLWNKFGMDIPGISKSDQKSILSAFKADPSAVAFADALGIMSKQTDGYVTPTDNWTVETIASDLDNVTNKIGRKKFLAEFVANREAIFGEWKGGKLVGPNMNKIEAIYGTRFREALNDMLWRMENGTNRSFGDNRLVNQFSNWVNNSVGAIMFLNARSAVLQTLSTVNFVNWSDNNVLQAGKAFANQPQFWKDFAFLFNSPMLKQRRKGLKTDVNQAELANAAAGTGNKAKAAFAYLLKIGFTPTQIADSFAIASGGATFYRNRVKTYLKQGMSQVDAEAKAFIDFQEIAEETQQSSRPDLISQQQASPLGRLVLAFQNTPMQYMRLTKKAIVDLANGRGDVKTNISKIIYYGAVQNLIFASLQKALFALAFDDDEEDEEKAKKLEKRGYGILNSMADSILRGMGVGGAIVSTLKNMILKFAEEEQKGWNADYDKVVIEFLNLSPPIGSKARKLKSAFSTWQYKKDAIKEMDKLNIDNPIWYSIGNVVSALTNVPLDRTVNKVNNLKEALDSRNDAWQRLFLSLGWNSWDLGVEKEEIDAATQAVKDRKAKERKAKKDAKEKAKPKATRCTATNSEDDRCGNMTRNKAGLCYAHD